MNHEFYCRLRRYYKDGNYEIWSIEFDYGDGYSAEDKCIIKFDNSNIKACMLIKSSERIDSEEYVSIILGLFEDIIPDDGDFKLDKLLDSEVDEYYPKDLIDMLESL